MHLLNWQCQYKASKDDKSNFLFKRMLFAKYTQAHAAFSRGFAISSDGYFSFRRHIVLLCVLCWYFDKLITFVEYMYLKMKIIYDSWMK